MKINRLLSMWKKFAAKLNENGIPLPTIRDPKTKEGSVSLTLVFISFNVVLISLVEKWSGAVGTIDISQSLNLFYACAALYWGRKLQGTDISKEVDSRLEDDDQSSRSKQKVDSPD